MRTLGIVGGIAPESTIAYYRLIVASYRKQKRDGSYPSIVITSIDLNRVLTLVSAQKLEELAAYLLGEVMRLVRAGADFALLASNTPHLVFEELRSQSPIPLISIVEAACAATVALRVKKVALFGTRFTMRAPFYPEVFARAGLAVIAPSADEQNYIHERYMGELIEGVCRDETRERLLGIVHALRLREGIEGVILGGTELSLLFRDGVDVEVPLLDTTRIHAESAVSQLLSTTPIARC